MKIGRRMTVIAVLQARRFLALAAMRAGRPEQGIRKQTFRPLTEAKTTANLGDERPGSRCHR